MKKYKLSISILLVLVLTLVSVFAGGGNRRGTAGAAQLTIPVGARGIALGGATILGATGVDAIYWNPANLARTTNNVDVSFSNMTYIADINVTHGAIGFTLGDMGMLGINIKSLAIGDINKTTEKYPDGTGSTYSPQFMTVGLTYSKMLSDRVAIGFTANLISETIEFVSQTGVSFDVGVSYTDLASIKGLSMAVVMKNIGPRVKYDGTGLLVRGNIDGALRPNDFYKLEAAEFDLPGTLEIALGYDLPIDEQNNIHVVGNFVNNNFWEDEYRVGLEYGYDKMLFLRAGYVATPQLEKEENTLGFSAGFGLNYNFGGMALKVDYAFRSINLPTEKGNHVVTIGLGL